MNDWKVVCEDAGKEWYVDSRAEAEERINGLLGMRDRDEFDIIPPAEDVEPEVVDHSQEASTDGGVVSEESEPAPSGEDIIESVDDLEQGYDLPDKPPVDEDPITWMPGSFTDEIEGQDVINRQGYEVMAHYYGIGTSSECEVGPEETDFEFCRVKATATTEDGTEYTAHGSAHVDRGDDTELLLEMADTRARKRSLAQATGVGMLAVSELKSDFEGGA